MASVTVDRGHHQHPVPKGLARLVEDELGARGIEGDYRLRFGPRVRGTPHTPRFKARGLVTEGGVELYLKPGGNDTACTCWLSPADAAATRCEVLVDVLRDLADPSPVALDGTPGPPPPPAADG